MADAGDNDVNITSDVDINEIRDMATQLADAASASSEMQANLRRSNQDIIDLKQAFEHIVRSSSSLPEHILTSDDLIKEMAKDAALFRDIQQQTLELGREQIDTWFTESIEALEERLRLQEEEFAAEARTIAQMEDRAASMQAQMDLTDRWNAAIEENRDRIQEVGEIHAQLHEEIGDQLERQFNILQRQFEVQEAQKHEMFDTKKAIDSLGESIRNPAKTAEGFMSTISQMPKKFIKARAEGKSVGAALSEAFNLKKLAAYAKYLANPFVAAIVAVVAVAVVLFKLFKNFYEFMEKNIIPAHADFNKELGTSTAEARQLEGQAASMGVQFELMGLQFAEGAKMVRDFAKGIQSVEPMDRETMKSAENLVGILGLGGEEAGRFALQISKQTGNLKALKEMMVLGGEEASRFGVPVATVQKDMAQAPDVFARFGVANRKAFAEATARARSYGLSIKEVDSAFGDQMATFEGTSTAAAKLNAIFGTQINSMELMMKQNPQERMELLRKELVNSGKEWGNLDEKEKMMIATTLNLSKSQAQLMLASEKERKELEEKAAAKKRDEKTAADWEKGIRRIQRTLLAWGKDLDNVMRGFTELIAAMLGVEKPGKMMTKIGKAIGEFMGNLAEKLTLFAKQWREGSDELPPFMKRLKFTISVLKLLGRILLVPIKSFIWFTSKLIDFFTWVGKVTGITEKLNTAIEWLSDGMNEVSKIFDETDFGAPFEAIPGVVDQAVEWIKESFNLIPEFIKDPLSMIGGFFKKWFFDKPKEIINNLIEWIPKNVGKIGSAISKYSGFDLVTGLFSGDEESAPKPTAKSKAVAKKAAKKKVPGKAKGKRDAGEQIEITFQFEGADEFAEAFSKIISVKQVKRSRRG